MFKWVLAALAAALLGMVAAMTPATAKDEQRGSSFFCMTADSGGGNIYYHSPTYEADVGISTEAYEQSFKDYMRGRGLPTKGGCTFTNLPENVPIYLDGLKQQCDDCSVWSLQRVDWAYKQAEPEGSRDPKDNLAQGACDLFTEKNYRERALAEGDDVQLRTMCGQAFEYYTMYRRALDQGYSVSDANRTYAAHEKSAAVLNDFFAKTSAEPGEGIVPDQPGGSRASEPSPAIPLPA